MLREDLNTTSSNMPATSAFRSDRTILTAATTSLDVMGIPLRRTRYSPIRTFSDSSTWSGSPVMVTTFPFGRIVTPRDCSTIFRWSSWLPNRFASTAVSSKRTVCLPGMFGSIGLPALPYRKKFAHPAKMRVTEGDRRTVYTQDPATTAVNVHITARAQPITYFRDML